MAKQIQKEIQRGVESWISLGNRRPHLSIILVGDNPASHTYVRKKIRAASAVGICSEIILKPKDVSQEELLDITDQLNMDPRVSGILVQLPLPDHVDERTVCNGIAPEKDVDGFHIINIGRLCLDQHSLIPATASAVWEIIKRTGIETFGKNVVVAGRSKNVGMPIAMLLHTDGEHERPGGDATVTIAHRYTPKEQLKIHTQLADIIIVAAASFQNDDLPSPSAQQTCKRCELRVGPAQVRVQHRFGLEVQENHLSREASCFHGWVLVAVAGRVAATNIFDRHALDIEAHVVPRKSLTPASRCISTDFPSGVTLTGAR
ncbi:bifunctional methylenetetrahydrofolate dehydrogenase/cyclohydrolase 2, mitochondrial isoform X7 [Canis lupus baileyi]